MNDEYFIPGRPATFATSQEKIWKKTIADHIGETKNKNNSLELIFMISKENFDKYAFDIDNLCDPVFTALVNKGWYNGIRSNIKQFKATKIRSDIEGVLLRDLKTIDFEKDSEPIFDEIYTGRFPNKATDDEIPDWIGGIKPIIKLQDICSVSLKFGWSKLSIASINGGKVKPIIDGLYPLIGGSKGNPDDHKIMELNVEKNCNELEENQVRVVVW